MKRHRWSNDLAISWTSGSVEEEGRSNRAWPGPRVLAAAQACGWGKGVANPSSASQRHNGSGQMSLSQIRCIMHMTESTCRQPMSAALRDFGFTIWEALWPVRTSYPRAEAVLCQSPALATGPPTPFSIFGVRLHFCSNTRFLVWMAGW